MLTVSFFALYEPVLGTVSYFLPPMDTNICYNLVFVSEQSRAAACNRMHLKSHVVSPS